MVERDEALPTYGRDRVAKVERKRLGDPPKDRVRGHDGRRRGGSSTTRAAPVGTAVLALDTKPTSTRVPARSLGLRQRGARRPSSCLLLLSRPCGDQRLDSRLIGDDADPAKDGSRSGDINVLDPVDTVGGVGSEAYEPLEDDETSSEGDDDFGRVRRGLRRREEFDEVLKDENGVFGRLGRRSGEAEVKDGDEGEDGEEGDVRGVARASLLLLGGAAHGGGNRGG